MSRCMCGHHANGSRPAAWCEGAICETVIWPSAVGNMRVMSRISERRQPHHQHQYGLRSHTLTPCEMCQLGRRSAFQTEARATHMNDDRAFPTHVIAHMQLRAPRVAYVVPVTDDWHRVALYAMNDITHCWGGAGFVVIPVGEDGVHPTVMAALREYDPDAVLTPDMSRIGERHRSMVDGAQLAISAACSNYRFPRVEAASVASPRFRAFGRHAGQTVFRVLVSRRR